MKTKSKLLLTLCVFGFVVCLAGLILSVRNTNSEIAYDQALSDVYAPSTVPADAESGTESSSEAADGAENGETNPLEDSGAQTELWTLDITGLREINDECVGWIWMPDTDINYPVVQCEDNSKYLSTKFDGTTSKEGTIFVDYQCDLDGNNLIIYGHNTSSGKFDSLNQYLKDDSYINSHPYFVYYSEENPTGVIYDIFSVFKADISTSEKIQATYRIVNDNDYQGYLNYLTEKSLIRTNVTVSDEQQLIILSTCCRETNKRCVVSGISRK